MNVERDDDRSVVDHKEQRGGCDSLLIMAPPSSIRLAVDDDSEQSDLLGSDSDALPTQPQCAFQQHIIPLSVI